MKDSLWLFDIDGTLVDTGGAGISALVDATREVFGSDGPPLDLAGSTDSGLLNGIYSAFGRQPDEATTALFFDRYLARLEVNLQDRCFGGRVLEGVLPLLTELDEAAISKGLLTGNIAAGAAAKMCAYGMEHFFPFGAYGDDHHDRNELGPIALARAIGHLKREFNPSDILVIGDTPKDIRCAKALGARPIAVATGRFGSEELEKAGAEVVFETLEDTDEVFRKLGF